MDGPDGKVGHAELEIGDSVIMLADVFPDMGQSTPKDLGGTPVMVMVYVEDADATVAKALAAGATEVSPVQDQFYGDRSGLFEDPWGHRWNVATHVEDVPPRRWRPAPQRPWPAERPPRTASGRCAVVTAALARHPQATCPADCPDRRPTSDS